MVVKMSHSRSASTIRAAVLRGPDTPIEIQHFEQPPLADGSVLLRTLYSEVCGTDVHLARGALQGVPYPIIPGHVSVGTVEARSGTAMSIDSRAIEIGDVVTFFDVHNTCNQCWHCLVAKASTKCPHRMVYGVTCSSDDGLLGGWSEKIYLKPGVQILHLPPGVSPLRFIAGGCALPTALHAIERARVGIGDSVLVQGAGPVGICTAIAAGIAGAGTVILVDVNATRIKSAKGLGFANTIVAQKNGPDWKNVVLDLTHGRGPDITIEATGDPSAVKDGMSITRDGGRYVVVGHYTDRGAVDLNPHLDINKKHLEIHGVWGTEFHHFYRAVQLLRRSPVSDAGSLSWESIVGGIFGLEKAEEALRAVRDGSIIKAVISPNSS